jgi:general nucleoside transport system ATP-binding protein
MEVLARLSGIKRSFGSVVALSGADLEIRTGEVHGVLGENGAGKSTLLNVLGGMVRPDGGSIEIGGEVVTIESPRDAWKHGIALVHQHFALVPALTALENLALGVGTAPSVRRSVELAMERTGLRVPLDDRVERLGVGDRQRIEVLKALLRDPRILILDEPTAVLTPHEVDGFFSLLREIAAQGRGIVLVGHKLDEVMGVADRVTVLRGGRTVLTGAARDHDVGGLVRAMVGGDTEEDLEEDPEEDLEADLVAVVGGRAERGRPVPVHPELARPERAPTAVVASLRDVHVSVEGVDRLRGVSVSVRRGEVLGVAGVESNGQRELALVLAGRLRPDAGEALLPEDIGFVPEDRSTEGLVADFDLVENVALALHRRSEYRDGVWLRWDAIREEASRIVEQYGIATPSTAALGGTLSGGNQQRVVVGREVAMAGDLLVAENPTRGLDVTAAAFVHAELRRLAGEGIAVVLVSTDLDEVLELSDRVCVVASGRLRDVPSEQRTRAGVGGLMLGADA